MFPFAEEILMPCLLSGGKACRIDPQWSEPRVTWNFLTERMSFHISSVLLDDLV
jgi:hypothetical protein